MGGKDVHVGEAAVRPLMKLGRDTTPIPILCEETEVWNVS